MLEQSTVQPSEGFPSHVSVESEDAGAAVLASSKEGATRKRKREPKNSSTRPESPRTLSLPEDHMHLSALHVFIRKQVEIFQATEETLTEPCHGRKKPIILSQVGVRCIHCVSSRKKAKRAVCYPSNLRRIYNVVSDMKCDHFQICPFVPKAVKDQIETLKKSSFGSFNTSNYYKDAALKIGLVDGKDGVFFQRTLPSDRRVNSLAVGAPEEIICVTMSTGGPEIRSFNVSSPPPARTMTMSTRYDHLFLSELHCFIRKQVELFEATHDDAMFPAPGRRTRIIEGQVGIRCKHCSKTPGLRTKRAICYPPSLSGIYHCVSNMKFDHFHRCPRLPKEEREMLSSLRDSPAKTSSKGKLNLLTTPQFYHKSAISQGLIDSEEGIRFEAKSNVLPDEAGGLDALAVAATVTK